MLARLRLVAPSGRADGHSPIAGKIDIAVLDLFHIRDGKLHWALLDNLGMLRQLGVTSI
ncbi:MAG: hypothetical protein JO110_30195 [Acetobacteraceae bacterium]|nr:hypothetical protein [Acetobacteraceae bacterium]